MARSTATFEVVARRQRYTWPDLAINIWIILMLGTAGTLIGVYANFIVIQQHFYAGIPWLFPYGITVGALTVLYVIVILALISTRRVLPVPLLILSFALFALYLTGLIETAIQLFGSGGNVNSNCQTYILGQPVSGRTVNTLAWLQQQSICQSWYAVFAFWIVGVVLLVWMCVIVFTVVSGNTG